MTAPNTGAPQALDAWSNSPVSSTRWSWAGRAGIVLSIALVGVLLASLDLREVGTAFSRAQPGPLIWATSAYVGLFVLRGLRWSILLKPLTPVSVPLATQAFLVGFMANNILPARLGDVVRAWVLAHRAGAAKSASFTTVMLERVFDGLTVVAVLALALRALPLEGHPGSAHLLGACALMGLIFAAAFAVSVFIALWPGPTLRTLERLVSPLPKTLKLRLMGLFEKLASGLQSLTRPSSVAAVAGLSVVVWTMEVVVYVGVATSLGLDLAPLELALVMAVLTLGLTLPSAPGFVGVFEALVIPTLALLGVAAETGAAFALILHAIHYLPGTLLGILSAWGLGLRLRP